MSIIFFLHSLWRWFVLAAFVVVILKMITGWFMKVEWSKIDSLLSTMLSTVYDVQFVLGLIVYIGSFMSLHILRWYSGSVIRLSMEHVLMMSIALIVAHITASRAKKMQDDVKRFRFSTLGFGLSLVLTLATIPTWAMTASL